MTCCVAGIDLIRKSHNAPIPYPTMHQFVTEMCTCVHISVTKWCIVVHLFNALWDLWDGSSTVVIIHWALRRNGNIVTVTDYFEVTSCTLGCGDKLKIKLSQLMACGKWHQNILCHCGIVSALNIISLQYYSDEGYSRQTISRFISYMILWVLKHIQIDENSHWLITPPLL